MILLFSIHFVLIFSSFTLAVGPYVDNGDGTVSDESTGLMWQQQHDDEFGGYWWEKAIQTCDDLELAGYYDWRLPRIDELRTVIDYSIFPPIDPVFSHNWGPYWSSSEYVNDTADAWFINSTYGTVSHTGKSLSCSIRCVRSGPYWPLEPLDYLFIKNDEVVEDIRTQLDWQRQDDGIQRNWLSAYQYCDELLLDGHDDWRLPEIDELSYIIDYTNFNPSVSTGYFNNILDTYYWSGTIYAASENEAWAVNFLDGYVSWEYKNRDYCVRCVRSKSSNLQVVVSPTAAPQGTTFSQTGSGFTPNSSVTLYFNGPYGTSIATEITDENGDYTHTWWCDACPVGAYSYYAVDDSTNAQSNTVYFSVTSSLVADAPAWVPLFRLYKGGEDNRDHLYTTNVIERDIAIDLGWTYERIEGSISNCPATGLVPLYRLHYNDGVKEDHFYTTDAAERDSAINNGNYSSEGIAGYVYDTPAPGAVALHRLYNANDKNHFYCIRVSESDYVKDNPAWTFDYEKVQCYVMPSESSAPLAQGRPSGRYGSANTAIGAFTYSRTLISFPSPGPSIRDHLQFKCHQ